jgi:hypothetical protein
MKAIHVIIIVLLSSLVSYSQLRYRDNLYLDVAVSASTKEFSGAISLNHLGPISKRFPKVIAGYGLRFTGFVAANQYYTTAPSKYTSPIQNPGTIFSRTLVENIDTITTATASTYSLNAVVHLQYNFHPRFAAGFNIDLAGVSLGPTSQFNVISSTFDSGQSPVVSGSATRFNLLLTSDNDIGSLNSEFYLRYILNNRIGLRAGYTFLFSEYTTEQKLSFDQGRINNDRYRLKAGMFLLGVSYRPFALQ